MTNTSQSKKARIVLEGRHGFQHRLLTQKKALDELNIASRRNKRGGLIIFFGAPGCGVTTVLKQFKSTLEDEPFWPRCEQFSSRVSLIDHVLDCAALRNDFDYTSSVPRSFIEFSLITGRRTIIIDGLEDYLSSKYSYPQLLPHIHRLATCSNGFLVVASTQDKKLFQKCRDLNIDFKQEIVLDDEISREESQQFINDFWKGCNEFLGESLYLSCELRTLALGDDNGTLSSLITRLEILYAAKMIGFELNLHSFADFETFELSVWNELYS
ncbi:hypothetical protein [Pseudomonas extremaustralis]